MIYSIWEIIYDIYCIVKKMVGDIESILAAYSPIILKWQLPRTWHIYIIRGGRHLVLLRLASASGPTLRHPLLDFFLECTKI